MQDHTKSDAETPAWGSAVRYRTDDGFARVALGHTQGTTMQDFAEYKQELIEKTFKHHVRHIDLDREVNLMPALSELGEYDDELRAALPEIAYAALAGVTCDPDPMAGNCHGFKVIIPGEWEWCYSDIARGCEKLGLVVLWSRSTEIGFPVKIGDVINGDERVVAVKEVKHDYFESDEFFLTWKIQLVQVKGENEMTESTVYRESLETELMENNADLVDMLVGKVEVDPIFLLNALAVVGLVDDSKDEEVMRVRNATVEVAKTVGRRVVREAVEQWDFRDLLLKPDMDKVEQNVILQSLVEGCGLFRFVECRGTRAAFQFALSLNKAAVSGKPDAYEGLDMTAIMVNDALPTSSGHMVKKFLKEIAKAAKPTWLKALSKMPAPV